MFCLKWLFNNDIVFGFIYTIGDAPPAPDITINGKVASVGEKCSLKDSPALLVHLKLRG
jgi:hypothetical protein